MDPALIALAGTLLGGVGVKIVEKIMNRGQEKTDTASELRAELRNDIARLREELKEEARDADLYKQKYWELKAELLIVNHKTNKVIEVVDHEHNKSGLGAELEGLEYPGR